MKSPKIKITLKRSLANKDTYKITKIVGAVTVFACSKEYGVGDFVPAGDAMNLSRSHNVTTIP